MEYIDKIKKMAEVFYDSTPRIFMRYSKKKKEFIKDQPALFIFGNRLCFMLAPRVNLEEENKKNSKRIKQ
jgi:hypothetical protein